MLQLAKSELAQLPPSRALVSMALLFATARRELGGHARAAGRAARAEEGAAHRKEPTFARAKDCPRRIRSAALGAVPRMQAAHPLPQRPGTTQGPQ